MKGGGLTWLGWLAIGVGGMLIYAGMTNQSLVSELSAVLNGDSPSKGAKPAGDGAGSAVGGVAGGIGDIAHEVAGGAGQGAAPAVGSIAGAIGNIGAHAGTLPQPYYRGA